MSKAITLTLIDNLGLTDTTNAEISRLYDDVVRELGMQVILTESSTVAQVAGTATYTPPTNTIRVLEIDSSFGILDQHDYHSLQNLFYSRFRDKVGKPVIWCHDHESVKDFRLVPGPTESDTLTVLFTQYQTDVPSWLELPIALEVLHREYARESNHQDIDFAMLCRQLANMWFSLVGIIWYSNPKDGRKAT